MIVVVAATDRGGGVQDVRLYDNGVPVATSAGGVGLARRQHCPPGATCFRVVLTAGRHEIEAVAVARDGSEGQRVVRPLVIPGRRRPAALHILAVGIDEYRNPAYRLAYARADAQAVVDSLRAGSRASSSRLLELLRQVPARQKLMIIDACQSGGVVSAYTWQEPARVALRSLAIGAGTWVVAASRPQESAAESGLLGHGVFTYALLRALGAEPGGRPREITVASVLNDVSARIPELSRRARTPMQTPVILGAGELFTLGIR